MQQCVRVDILESSHQEPILNKVLHHVPLSWPESVRNRIHEDSSCLRTGPVSVRQTTTLRNRRIGDEINKDAPAFDNLGLVKDSLAQTQALGSEDGIFLSGSCCRFGSSPAAWLPRMLIADDDGALCGY
jgi:hypothetical protein